MIQTYSLIPSRSLKSRLSSLRSKKPLLLVKTRCRGSWPLWMMFVSCMWFWSPQSAWWPSSTHTSSRLGLNPQQLRSSRLLIWKERVLEVDVLRIKADLMLVFMIFRSGDSVFRAPSSFFSSTTSFCNTDRLLSQHRKDHIMLLLQDKIAEMIWQRTN